MLTSSQLGTKLNCAQLGTNYRSIIAPDRHFFSAESDADLNDLPNIGSFHFRCVLPVADLCKGGLRQLFQILFRIFAGFQFKQKTGKARGEGEKLNIESAQPGLAVGANGVAVIEHGAQADHQALIKRFAGCVKDADRLEKIRLNTRRCSKVRSSSCKIISRKTAG